MAEEVKVYMAEARPAIEARPTAADNAAKDFIQTVARAATHSQIDYMKKSCSQPIKSRALLGLAKTSGATYLCFEGSNEWDSEILSHLL